MDLVEFARANGPSKVKGLVTKKQKIGKDRIRFVRDERAHHLFTGNDGIRLDIVDYARAYVPKYHGPEPDVIISLASEYMPDKLRAAYQAAAKQQNKTREEAVPDVQRPLLKPETMHMKGLGNEHVSPESQKTRAPAASKKRPESIPVSMDQDAELKSIYAANHTAGEEALTTPAGYTAFCCLAAQYPRMRGENLVAIVGARLQGSPELVFRPDKSSDGAIQWGVVPMQWDGSEVADFSKIFDTNMDRNMRLDAIREQIRSHDTLSAWEKQTVLNIFRAGANRSIEFPVGRPDRNSAAIVCGTVRSICHHIDRHKQQAAVSLPPVSETKTRAIRRQDLER